MHSWSVTVKRVQSMRGIAVEMYSNPPEKASRRRNNMPRTKFEPPETRSSVPESLTYSKYRLNLAPVAPNVKNFKQRSLHNICTNVILPPSETQRIHGALPCLSWFSYYRANCEFCRRDLCLNLFCFQPNYPFYLWSYRSACRGNSAQHNSHQNTGEDNKD